MSATAMLPPAQASYSLADQITFESSVFLASMEFGRVASAGLTGNERAKCAGRSARVTWDNLILGLTLAEAAERVGVKERRARDARRLADAGVEAVVKREGELPEPELADVMAYMAHMKRQARP